MPKKKTETPKDKTREELKAEAKAALDNGTWSEKFGNKKK